jgi:thiamine-phosphate pyrophosphorylase
MRDNNINIPLVAIGGITKDDVSMLLQNGVDGIALSSSVLMASHPVMEMREIYDKILFNK